jgi:uncharacterized protein YgiM (DUF1202 family)
MNIKQLVMVLLAAGTIVFGLYVYNLSTERDHTLSAYSNRHGVVFSPTGWTELRGRPNAESLLMSQVMNDVRLQVLGEEGEWVKVRTEKGRTGYVKKSDFRY